MASAGMSAAGDWPQILGPQRSGIAVDEKLADAWPEGGPKLAWQADCGSGLAGVVVSKDTVVMFHRRGGDEIVQSYDLKSGKSGWSAKFPSSFEPAIVNDDGPRSVPLIHDGAVFAFGAEGALHAVDLASGKTRWTRPLGSELDAPSGYFGFGSAPAVVDGVLIVNLGAGKKKSGIAGLDPKTGKTIWSSTDELASYSGVMSANWNSQSTALVLTRFQLVALDPKTGKERWRTPFGQRGPTVNGALPVVWNDRVFLTASYGIGSKLVTVKNGKPVVDYEGESFLASQYATPILLDGRLYAVDGRQDGGGHSLKCIDALAKKVLWQEPLTDYATLISADGKLIVVQTNGQARLVQADPARYHELAVGSVGQGTFRALPALSNGLLLVRNETSLRCLKVDP